jgi:tetratricopeptide (TPR) repeat protein
MQPAQFLQQGLAQYRKGDLSGAESCFIQALDQRPGDIDALNLLAMVLAAQKKYGEAVKQLQAALAIKPDDPVLLGNIGGLLNEANEPLTAIKYLHEALRIKPDHTDAIVSLALALESVGRIDQARKQIDRALKQQPAHARALMSMAILEKNCGNPQRAIEAFRRFRRYYPKEISPLVQILLSDRVKEDLPELRQAESLVRESLPHRDSSALHQALAKAYDDLNRYDEAMTHLRSSKAGITPFDMEAHRRDYSVLKELFVPAFMQERAGWGLHSDLPVFIVGMPRSGTSLVEQIIASHPKAYGAGELDDIGVIAAAFGMKGVRADAAVDPERIRALSAAQIAAAAEKYLESLSSRSPKASRITDKMPHNYERLGLIALLFPNARIIHCRRDAMDTCLSIYMQNLRQAHEYASDLRVLGEYYGEYVQLMELWQATLPLRILDVAYEQLIEDPPTQVRRIIDFLGLKWDDACLSFHRTRRSVSTSSHWQVRQPIYASSVRRWKNYREHLQPLIDGLGKYSTANG